VSRGTALPDPPDGIPLSEREWDVVAALEQQLDLEGPCERALEVAGVTFCHQLAAWLRWLLDPRLDGLPMPRLLSHHRARAVQLREQRT
jgi:hypothetical protein